MQRTGTGSSMVTVMARNGVNFGIRLSGTGERWFQAPANPVDGLYFPGYTGGGRRGGLGDSAITETNGLGGFAMAASPAIVQFVGGSPPTATANSRRMLSHHAREQSCVQRFRRSTSRTPAGIRRPLGDRSACCRSSILASLTARQASVRSAQASRRRRWHASTMRLLPWHGARCCPARQGEVALDKTAVIAFGGNALVTDAGHDSIPDQYRRSPHCLRLVD